MSETAIVKACIQVLTLANIPHARTNSGRAFGSHKNKAGITNKWVIKFGTVGWPDITAILPPAGKFLGIECKKPLGPRGGKSGREQSDEQIERERQIKSAGGEYLVIRSGKELEMQLRNWGVLI